MAAHRTALKRGDVERAVHRDEVIRSFLDADNALAVLLIGSAELSGYRIIADGDVVAVENRERLVTDKALAAEDCVAETLGLLLADEIYICKVCDSFDLFVDFFLILLAGKICLKLEGMVEVVFDNSLPRLVMIRMSSIPAATASSTRYWIAGLSTMLSISFGTAWTRGELLCRDLPQG